LLYNFAIKSDEIPNNYANVSKIYTDKANKNTSAFYIIDKKFKPNEGPSQTTTSFSTKLFV
jgi:hypothetical protein